MNPSEIKQGMKVKTTNKLGSTIGMLINPRYLCARRPNTEGILLGHVPGGHGGDVFWVKHGEADIGPYCFNEFQPI